MAKTPAPLPPAPTKADRDNHSRQLNPNNPEFQRSRTPHPPAQPVKKPSR